MTKRVVTLSLIAALGMVGLAQTAVAETVDVADTVLFLQVSDVADCYVVHVTKPQNLVYGDIVGYPAIFSGSQKKGKITVGWTIDGGSTAFLTVFHPSFLEELWQYVPGSGFSLHSTGTWSYTGSCFNVDSQRPRQVQ